MEKFCEFCGTTIDESGNYKNKKMCVNCSFVERTEDGYICNNSSNMSEAKSKMEDAARLVAGGYAFTIDVKPLPLKKPTAKCSKWELSENIVNIFKKSFE